MKTGVPYGFCAQRLCARAVAREGPPQVAPIQIRFERLTFFKPPALPEVMTSYAMKNNDQRSSLIWCAIGLAIVLYSGKYGLGTLSSPGPGFVPFLTGLIIGGLSLVVFLQQWREGKKERLKDLWTKKDWPTMLKVLGALVLYATFVKSLGFLLTTFFFILYLFRVIESMAWRKVLIGAILTAFGSYVIFEVWLEAQLPTGIFGF